MSGNRNKIIAFNYFGGKFTWLEHLYKKIPTKTKLEALGADGSRLSTLKLISRGQR